MRPPKCTENDLVALFQCRYADIPKSTQCLIPFEERAIALSANHSSPRRGPPTDIGLACLSVNWRDATTPMRRRPRYPLHRVCAIPAHRLHACKVCSILRCQRYEEIHRRDKRRQTCSNQHESRCSFLRATCTDHRSATHQRLQPFNSRIELIHPAEGATENCKAV
jgi:hypothetical protein